MWFKSMKKFGCVASIYKSTMIAHGLTTPILVKLSKIENKVRAHIVWDILSYVIDKYHYPKKLTYP